MQVVSRQFLVVTLCSIAIMGICSYVCTVELIMCAYASTCVHTEVRTCVHTYVHT